MPLPPPQPLGGALAVPPKFLQLLRSSSSVCVSVLTMQKNSCTVQAEKGAPLVKIVQLTHCLFHWFHASHSFPCRQAVLPGSG